MSATVVLAPSHAVAMSIAVAKDLLWVAQREAGSRDPVLVVTADGEPAQCGGGMRIAADASLDDAPPADVVVAGAFWGDADDVVGRERGCVEWLRQQHARGALVAGVSTGTFLLAETALLDGGIATTYQPYASAFRRRYPAVELQPQRAMTEWGRLWCAGGINSGCDLIVSVIERTHGRAVARGIAERFLIDFSRAYDVANVRFDGQKQHGDALMLDVQRWLEEHAGEPATLADVAQRFALSRRQLTRRFCAATGETPGSYLRRVRMEAAGELLRATRLTVPQIARRVGYCDATAFHRAFRRHTQTTPSDYRRAHHAL